jgi:hypothetical protein
VICLLDNCRMLAIYPFELSFVYPDTLYRLSLFLVSHLLYTSVSLVSFPFEYIIHGLPVMNNMSHALFGWSPLLIFPSRVRFVFFVESNIHPLTCLCFGCVFWHIYQFTFSVDHLLYTSVSLVFLTMRVYYLRSDGNR